ncbi:MAG TPA: pitrilysin family protein [Verrucomicrobiae bacterium]|nr:pitrilysin family protein [Verrucomicrobiae bacterium]
MKKKSFQFAAVISGAILLFSGAGCRTKAETKTQRAPAMVEKQTASAPAQTEQTGVSNSDIPDLPNELKFPPLNYEPPSPQKYRVPLQSGPVAYIVPDKELPLVNISVYVHTGSYLDPKGKEGLAELTGYLLAHSGIPGKTAEQLDERLAFLAAMLSSGVGGTQGSVSLNLLSKDLDEGLGILRGVLTAPQFQEDKIALRKQQLLQAMQQRNDDSSSIQSRQAGFLAYGTNFWANDYSTADSIQSITRDDLEAFHKKWFYPSNFVVAVSGDFDRAEMTSKLEKLFSEWPFTGEQPPPIPTNTTFAAPGVYIVNKDVNQGRVAMMLPGITRDNPDYFPAIIMNDILGGGGFTSRIMNRVRSDEGLAYSAYSSFPGGVYYPLTFTAAFQSKSRTVAYAASLVLQEIGSMTAGDVTKQELETSKSGFIETFPRTFATKAQVASTFAQDEFTGRYAKDPNYWKNVRNKINAVTQQDVLRVAKKYLHTNDMVILVVGNKKDILLGYPGHPVKLQDLAGGNITELPLRDPMTMKPLPLADKNNSDGK